MSKAVLLSIQPKWCELITSGKKTVEVRKRIPKLEPPYKCYIYETQGRTETPFVDEEGHFIFKGRGEVIAEFICDDTECFAIDYRGDEKQNKRISETSCVSLCELDEYGYNSPCLYALHISELKVYDKPKSLSEFKNSKNKIIERAFQSWGYVED